VLLGSGQATLERAAHALFHWDMHRRAGLTVAASSPTARRGTVVRLTLGWRGLGITAPCRVIYTIEETNRRGFAYGTLPGHPESGEEAFLIEHRPNDDIWLNIRAFSRPARLLPYLAGPLTRKAQDLVTDRYVTALRGSRTPPS
jgi:uncharacterized protein (UPF0548 family)